MENKSKKKKKRKIKNNNKKNKKDEQEQEEHCRRKFFFHDEARLKITFLQLTSGLHVTISKDWCSWNDRRQPVFAVTPLFTRFYFIARLGRHFRHRSYGNCKGYDNTET